MARVPAPVDHSCFQPAADLFPGGERPDAFEQETVVDLVKCGFQEGYSKAHFK
jgi:hypothetical protein